MAMRPRHLLLPAALAAALLAAGGWHWQAGRLSLGRKPATARDRLARQADLLDEELRRALAPLDEERALTLAARGVALREELDRQDPGALATYLNDLGVDLLGNGCAVSNEAWERAHSLLARALALRAGLGAPLAEAESLTNLATLATYRSRWDEAAAQEERALKIYLQKLPPADPRIGDSLFALGNARKEQGHYSDAAALYDRARPVFQGAQPRDDRRLADLFNSLGELRRIENNYGDAEESLRLAYEQALKIESGGDLLLAHIINNQGGIAQDEGDYHRAEILDRKSLEIRQRSPETCPRDLATAYLNLGEIHRLQGDYATAEPLLANGLALDIKALSPDDPELASHFDRTARLYQDERHYDRAKPLYEEALRLTRTALGPEHPQVAQSLHDLADLDAEVGDTAPAEALYRQALAIRERSLGERDPSVAVTLTRLARLLGRTGREAEARAALDRALAIFADTRAEPAAKAEAWGLRAELRKRRGDREGALSDLQRSLEIVEGLRPLVGGGERQGADFLARFAGSYDRMIEWQLEAGRLDQAVEYAERSRARVLVDQLAEAKVDLRSRIPEARRRPLEKREAEARSRLAETNRRISLLAQRGGRRGDRSAGADPEALSKLLKTRDAAELELERVEADIAGESPLWRRTAGAPSASLSAIQSQLAPPGGLILLYQVGATASHLFVLPREPGKARVLALVVPPAAAAVLGVAPGALDRDKLRRILKGDATGTGGILESLGQNPHHRPPGGDGAVLLPRLHALWQVLVPAGLWEQVRTSSEVIVLPGPLHPLPFEALVVSPGASPRFWLDDGPSLRYAASATTLSTLAERGQREVREPAGGASIVSVSDPTFAATAPPGQGSVTSESARERFARAGEALTPLPGTAAETGAILAVFGDVRARGEVLALQGTRADERSVRAALAGKRILHIATHGIVDERRNELFAALALAASPGGSAESDGDGLLQLFEIYQLDLDADLAVLSACSTHAGPEVEGEGVFALSRGFLIAGARRVVASLWQVNDRATAVLMGELFRGLGGEERAGRRPRYAEALRAAKAAVRARPEWSDPYYWAPFTLSGER
jgi:CHAT domain-containing protein/tetratricopeptide (TPR) repeat protein